MPSITVRLTSNQRAHLRSRAHDLKPVLQVGTDGVTDAFLRELDTSFNTRELLKVKVLQTAPIEVDAAADAVRDGLPNTHVVQTVGRTMVLYRAFAEDPEIELPE